jgi:hypothetical protein
MRQEPHAEHTVTEAHVSAIVLLATLLIYQPSGGDCKVRLESRPVSQAHDIAVDVALVNVGTSLCVVFPHWFATDRGATVVPRGWLRIEVTGPTGRLSAAATGVPIEDDRLRVPSVSDFLILAPGQFWGMRVDLSRGAWAVAWPKVNGQFTIAARVEIAGQDWLRGQGITKNDPPTSQFVEGSFKAAPITITLHQ